MLRDPSTGPLAMGVRMIKRVLLFLARPVAEPSALECIAFAVVGVILARTIGVESLLGSIGVAFAVVYVLGLLRLAMDAAAGGRGA